MLFQLQPDLKLLFAAAFAIFILIALIGKFRFNPFIALVLSSLFMGVLSGMELPEVARVFQEGLGTVLGSVAVIVGLGTMIGKLLAASGGADELCKGLLKVSSTAALPWVMLAVAIIVGMPVFFSVGLVILFPLVVALTRKTGGNLLYVGVPVWAGLSVMHGLVPPHPGPMAAVSLLGADVGKTILWSLVVGIPIAALTGPVLGKLFYRKVHVEAGTVSEKLTAEVKPLRPAGFWTTLITLLLPILLMAGASFVAVDANKASAFSKSLTWLGTPLVALLIGTLLAYYTFGYRCGFKSREILKMTEECLGPIAGVFLVVGGGGGFSRVLTESGVGKVLAEQIQSTALSPLVVAWLLAVGIRIATGSATVAITTAAGILAPILQAHPDIRPELFVISLGAGSLILSHVNDGGFWFVKEYFNLTVPQTLRTWTVMETVISILGLIAVLILNQMLN